MNAVHLLDERHILLFLVQVFLILTLAKLLGLLFARFRQPTVTADMLVGVLLGPSILGWAFPSLHRSLFPADPSQIVMLDTVAWLGIFFLLLVTGLEVNFSSVWKHRGKAAWIAFSDIIIPILLSAAVLYFLPARYLVDADRRLLFTFFIATIMTISAMPVSIRVMQDMKLLRTDLGFLTISALSINDIIGWVVFTIILGIFSHGSADLAFVGKLVLSTLLFVLFAATVGKWTVDAILTAVRRRAPEASGGALTTVSLAGFSFGAITQAIGIHALFGFFLAGLVAGESHNLSEKTRLTIERVVYAVFVPVFFANIGLKVDILANFDLFLVFLLTLLGIGARFVGAYIGTVLAHTPRVQRWPVSALHTPGGEMHIVIAALALELGLISQIMFVAIVVAAIVSSMTLGPWLALILKRVAPAETVIISKSAAVEVVAEEKMAALRELAAVAASRTGLEVEAVFETARQREESISTGLGNAIAIPHARMEECRKPEVVFGRSQRGIDWDSPDGQPARLLFFILSPADETDTQLRIYRQLAGVLASEELRSSLLSAATPADASVILNDQLRVRSVAA